VRMYTNDLEPDLEVTLASSDGPVDVSTASSIRVIGKRGTDIIFDRAPTDTDIVGDTSVVTMAWQAGDTDEIGRIQVEVEVTWPGVRPQTFRPDGGVDVLRDFDLVP
jgi:hypothetical protein